MQSKPPIQVERAVRLTRPGDRNCRPHRVVVLICVRNDDVEAVDGTAQKNDDKALLSGIRVLDCPSAGSEGNESQTARCGGISKEVATPHANSPLTIFQQRMNSGLPRRAPACFSCGSRATAERVALLKAGSNISRRGVGLMGLGSAFGPPYSPAPKLIAKESRRSSPFGSSHADCVHAYPSGV